MTMTYIVINYWKQEQFFSKKEAKKIVSDLA